MANLDAARPAGTCPHAAVGVNARLAGSEEWAVKEDGADQSVQVIGQAHSREAVRHRRRLERRPFPENHSIVGKRRYPCRQCLIGRVLATTLKTLRSHLRMTTISA